MSLAVIARELRSLEQDVAHLQSIRRGGDPISGRRPRISPGRTHKASNAESILRHALRRLGWSREWRSGELTERQRLRLLDAIRQYGRAWLRHEAEQFFREYGRPIEAARSLAAAMQHHVGRFFGRVRTFVRELILAGMKALHGPAPLDADDLAAADHQADIQAAFLDRFEADTRNRTPAEIAPEGTPIDPDAMSAAQFAARAELYGNAAWATQNWRRAKALRGGGVHRERRLHLYPRPDKHACAGCLAESDKGWQPAGTLKPIGACQCKINCDCYFVYDPDPFATTRKPGEPPKAPHPAGPLTPEQLDELMGQVGWKATVVMGQ